MVRLLPLLPLFLLVACEPVGDPTPGTAVELTLSTPQCEPDFVPDDHFFVADHFFEVQWRTLCVRDRSSFAWQAVKVSLWDDRAEDIWNVWFLDPELESVRYGDADLPGVVDPANDAFPSALERVPPLAPLPAGDYRVEVWGVLENLGDSQRAEVRLTVLP